MPFRSITGTGEPSRGASRLTVCLPGGPSIFPAGAKGPFAARLCSREAPDWRLAPRPRDAVLSGSRSVENAGGYPGFSWVPMSQGLRPQRYSRLADARLSQAQRAPREGVVSANAVYDTVGDLALRSREGRFFAAAPDVSTTRSRSSQALVAPGCFNCFGDSHELNPATAPLRSRLRYGWGVFAGSYRAATVRERLRGTVSPGSVKHPLPHHPPTAPRTSVKLLHCDRR